MLHIPSTLVQVNRLLVQTSHTLSHLVSCVVFFELTTESSVPKSTSVTGAMCGSVAKLCLTLCDPMNCSMPGFAVLHYLLEFGQIHFH